MTNRTLFFIIFSCMRTDRYSRWKISIVLFALLAVGGCSDSPVKFRDDIRPRVLRDVPSQNLAYRLETDVSPPANQNEDADKFAAVANDFATKRQDDALLRTVVSPDGRRVLALYGTEAEPSPAFRIDLYNADGQFMRNVIPPDLTCIFPETVAWSPDGTFINFIARRRATPSPSPTPIGVPDPLASPVPAPSIAPSFAPVVSFNTEQIYICNRDGYDLKPLTSREGLIYFYFVWSPDSQMMAALACKEDEWTDRERQFKLPAGRPRLISFVGEERLLDDGLTEALPVWSPDASKVATAFDTEVGIYDVRSNKPTQAKLPLNDQLLSASVTYEERTNARKIEHPDSSQPTTPASFNPIVRLDWISPERLYIKTAYVRVMPSEAINTFQRWHLVNLSAQAAILK
jgi:hypothetical protein